VWARQASNHGLKVGLKDKMADVLRAVLALIDANADGSLTRDEIRVYAAKVRKRGQPFAEAEWLPG
jgi:NTP pyrophosphatase (non-canonical NTP hydrolase)